MKLLASAIITAGLSLALILAATSAIAEEVQSVEVILRTGLPVSERERGASKISQLSEPSKEASETPAALVQYFCDALVAGNYEAMYGAMLRDYRDKVSLETYIALFEEDSTYNGGIRGATFMDDAKQSGSVVKATVLLEYNSPRAMSRKVVAACVSTPKGFRLVECGLIPVDLNNL